MYERMWCRACGTVTEDFRCDCNSWPIGHEMWREPKFVNYADSLQTEVQDLLRINNELREAAMNNTGQCENTDHEIWRGPDEGNGSYYADSIYVTKEGALGINCGGHVVVLPIREWHRLGRNMTTEISLQAVEKAAEYPAKPILTWLGRDIS